MIRLFGPYNYRDLAPSIHRHIDTKKLGEIIITRDGYVYRKNGNGFSYYGKLTEKGREIYGLKRKNENLKY